MPAEDLEPALPEAVGERGLHAERLLVGHRVEVRVQPRHEADAAACFVPTRPDHWLADLPALARRRLVARGMSPGDIHGGDLCTISEPKRFFSHRRDGRSGRIATLAWMQA